MKNSYQKFLESFLDEFSKTNSVDSVTEKTDDLFAEIVEISSASILRRLKENEIRGSYNTDSHLIGDTVQQFNPDTWGDSINFDDENLGQVVIHKKTNRKGVVIRSDQIIHRTEDDGVHFKSGKKIPAAPAKSSSITGWEVGKNDPVYDRRLYDVSKLDGVEQFGDVRVALMKPDGSINPRGRLHLWFAEEYEATGKKVDVPELVATAKRTDKVHNRAASWKSKNKKAMPAIRYQRAEDGSWELANPQDFDEKTRAELIAKMEQLPDEISAEELERWRKREEATQIEKNAKDSGLVSKYMNYGDADDRLDPDL